VNTAWLGLQANLFWKLNCKGEVLKTSNYVSNKHFSNSLNTLELSVIPAVVINVGVVTIIIFQYWDNNPFTKVTWQHDVEQNTELYS